VTPLRLTLQELARESGRLLGELGVDPGDRDWIRAHAETIASLAGERRRGWLKFGIRRALRRRQPQEES